MPEISNFVSKQNRMTILQQPDSLSLSLNLKRFIISSDTRVSFILKKGDLEVLAQQYDPDANGRIEIDMRDVVVAVERALPDGGDGRTLIRVGDIDLGTRLLADALCTAGNQNRLAAEIKHDTTSSLYPRLCAW